MPKDLKSLGKFIPARKLCSVCICVYLSVQRYIQQNTHTRQVYNIIHIQKNSLIFNSLSVANFLLPIFCFCYILLHCVLWLMYDARTQAATKHIFSSSVLLLQHKFK